MDGDIVTVDCINSERCGGRVTLRLMDLEGVLPGGTDFKGSADAVVRQTCECEYSEDERQRLADLAEFQLERQRREQPGQG